MPRRGRGSRPDRKGRAGRVRGGQGLKMSEIAAGLALTVSQVEQALFAARNRLAEHLIFGERLSCDVVRRLAAGRRDASEPVADGPFAGTKAPLGGYYVVDCEAEDQALDAAARIPGARFGAIEVRPIAQM